MCVDGIAADGTVNRNCGAESAIHTQLSMLALDAHPAIARAATALTRTTATDGIRVVEAESGTLTGSASIVTPPSAWTGSANWSGGRYVAATSGDTVTVTLPAGHPAARVLPIADLGPGGSGSTFWTAALGRLPLPLGASQNVRAGQQGIGPSPVFLLPQTLPIPVPAAASTVTARVSGTARLDAMLVQPIVSHLGLAGASTALEVYVNASRLPLPQRLDTTAPVTVTRYDSAGTQVGAARTLGPHGFVAIEPGGFTTVASQ